MTDCPECDSEVLEVENLSSGVNLYVHDIDEGGGVAGYSGCFVDAGGDSP